MRDALHPSYLILGGVIMISLTVKGKEYKIKFGYNSFCDTDLMDRVEHLLSILQGNEIKDDNDIAALGMIKELFVCVRELVFVGVQKYNPIGTLKEVGDMLDDYKDEETEDDKRGLFGLLMLLTKELLDEGFLGDVLGESKEKKNKKPQDHKAPKK